MITVGEVLKKQRNNLGKSLEQVALDTKIQLRFLEYIEEDNFDKFDSPVFAQGFIKIYAKYLDLNEDRILAIYRRSVPENSKKTEFLRETIKREKVTRLNITPKLLIVSLSILFLLGILTYIGYQIYQFQSPPQISITTPENDLTVTDESIDVMGVTDSNSSVFVNDKPVEITSNGEFQYPVTLNPGVNLITVLAKKNGSTQESIETIRVNYTVDNNEKTEKIIEEEKPNTVRLEIVNSSVWVQLNVDKINKLSQIVQVGEEYEYEVNEQFSLTTGIINSTKLFFNDEEVPISRGESSVGSLNCEIINKDQINCQ
jgi:cytoskeletal protein RodZ